MFLSILFVVLFLGTAAGLVLFPQSETPVSGVKRITLSIAGLFCGLALAAWTGMQLQKRVSLEVPLMLLFLLAAAVWSGICRERRVQKLCWQRWEIVSVLLLVFVICGIALHVFSPSLAARYSNDSGAEQFLIAMRLLRGEMERSTLSVWAYAEALVLALVRPFLQTARLYQALIVAKILGHMIEAALFGVVVYAVSDRKIVRYGATVMGFFYLLGYPALSILWADYEYWSGNAVALLLGIYFLLELERLPLAKVKQRTQFVVAGTVCTAVLLVIALFFAPVFSGFLGGHVSSWKAEGMYRCMYGDLLFFVPAFLFVAAFVFFRKKRLLSLVLLGMLMILQTVLLYVLWYQSLIDTYYYFSGYYNLWVLGWILAAAALDIAAEHGQLPVLFSYVGFLAVLGILTWTDYDAVMYERNPHYTQAGTTRNFFALYRQTAAALRLDYAEYEIPGELFAAMAYVAEDAQIENAVFLTEDASNLYWYEAFTGQDGAQYRLGKEEFPEIIALLEENGQDAIVVSKKSAEYAAYHKYFAQCTVAYENAAAAVYTPAGESWTDLQNMQLELAEEKTELFSYVKDNLQEDAPLMAGKDAYMEFLLYRNLVGRSMEEFYTWKYGALENVENLNAHDIHYVVVLYGEEYYENAQYYFDRFDVVFENEAGKVVRCNGTAWTTEYEKR